MTRAVSKRGGGKLTPRETKLAQLSPRESVVQKKAVFSGGLTRSVSKKGGGRLTPREETLATISPDLEDLVKKKPVFGGGLTRSVTKRGKVEAGTEAGTEAGVGEEISFKLKLAKGFAAGMLEMKGDDSDDSQSDANASSASGPPVTYDDFVWALENVRSRSFSGPYAGTPIKDRLLMGGALAAAGLGYAFIAKIPTESVLNAGISVACFNLLYDVVLSSRLKWYAMCPIIDSLNHSGRVKSNIEYEYFKDTFVVSTESAYASGDQVFISYGEKTNEQLVQYYGFLLEDNPHDTCILEAEIGGRTVQLAVTAMTA